MKIVSKRHPLKQQAVKVIDSLAWERIITTNLCPEIVNDDVVDPTIDFNLISGSIPQLEKILLTLSTDTLLPLNFFHEAQDDHDSITEDPFSPRFDSKARFYSRADDRVSEASETETECGAEQALVGYKHRMDPCMDTGSFYAPYVPQMVRNMLDRVEAKPDFYSFEVDRRIDAFHELRAVEQHLSRRAILEQFFDVDTAGL